MIQLFEAHNAETEFDADTLSVYFMALVGQRLILERECRVSMPTKTEVRRKCRRIVDDFLKAYFKS